MSIKPNRKTRDSRLSKIQQKWIAPPKDKPWVKIYLDTLNTENWRDLKINARRVFDALICHHFRHAQCENGNLEISYSGFEKAGVSNRDYVAPSLQMLIDAGMLSVGQGVATCRGGFLPNIYEITMYRDTPGIGYIHKSNRAFVWLPVEVMESPAWCRMSINERRMLDRLLIENVRHRGDHNGRLRVSYGIGARFIALTIRKLVASGLLAITKGRRQRGFLKPPNLYRITFLGTIDNPPSWHPSPETPSPKKPRRKSRKEILALQYGAALNSNEVLQ